jgi:hypothetical protein
MRALGIELAARNVLEKDYEKAKRLFTESTRLSF